MDEELLCLIEDEDKEYFERVMKCYGFRSPNGEQFLPDPIPTNYPDALDVKDECLRGLGPLPLTYMEENRLYIANGSTPGLAEHHERVRQAVKEFVINHRLNR